MEDAAIHLGSQARGVLKEFTSHGWAEMLNGLAVSSIAIRRSLVSKATVGPYWAFFRAYAGRLAGLYAIVGALGFTILAPVVALLMIFNRGLLVNLIAFVVPHLAYESALHSNVQNSDEMFFRTLEGIDPEYAGRMRTELGTKARSAGGRSLLSRALTSRVQRWMQFGRHGLAFTLAGFVPGIGDVISIASGWIAQSDLATMAILEPWFDVKGMRDADKRRFISLHRWMLLGFTLPFTLLSVIPFIGGLVAAAAHSAVAYLVYYQLDPPSDEQRRAVVQADLQKEASRIEAVTSQPVAAAKAVGQHIAPVAGATIRESMKTAARVLAPGGLNSQPTSSIHEAK